jgi:hypothetical protein
VCSLFVQIVLRSVIHIYIYNTNSHCIHPALCWYSTALHCTIPYTLLLVYRFKLAILLICKIIITCLETLRPHCEVLAAVLVIGIAVSTTSKSYTIRIVISVSTFMFDPEAF